MHATATPAFGRDYTSKAKVIADFEAGKDFHIALGLDRERLGNKESLLDMGIRMVNLRYSKRTKVAVHKF